MRFVSADELDELGLHKEASGNSSNGKCPATYFTRVPVAEWYNAEVISI